MRKTYIVIYNRRDNYGFGQPIRVLWEAPVDIARAVCGDGRTKGTHHFLGWTYQQGQRVKWVRDDGRYDDVLRDLGIRNQEGTLMWKNGRR